ncbi:hypothetical protein FQT01_07110 [Enterococcus faecalis]|uniref:hypothetical protein n=1 Tax=Enterococcus faecalis TaxID=1351 RepID=UPI001A970FA7|nr:hypothetical protein [Enterococcus faecalis]MBO1105081.1 hypothetical protein [Enterococcus faecalis]HCQ2036579.1 hypothetical protein [Staphylococcus aureus]
MNEKLWGDDKVVPMRKDGGGNDMGGGNYVTHKELELTQQSIERKIDSTENNIIGQLGVLNEKINNHEDKIKEVDKKINWLIALAVLSIGVPIFLKLFFP